MEDGRNFRDIFHAKLDRDYDERREQLEEKLRGLEEERKKGHEWIEAAPETVLLAFAEGGVVVSGEGNRILRTESRRVSLYEPVKSIVESIDPREQITSAIIYDALLQAIPSLEYENEWKLKARIAATLGRLVDEKLLKVKKPGRGSAPTIYVIQNQSGKTMNEEINQGPKETK